MYGYRDGLGLGTTDIYRDPGAYLLVLQIGLLVVTPGNVEVHLRAEVVLPGVPLLVGKGLVVGGEQGEVTFKTRN